MNTENKIDIMSTSWWNVIDIYGSQVNAIQEIGQTLDRNIMDITNTSKWIVRDKRIQVNKM